MAQEQAKQTFQDLLNEELTLIGKFEEHLNFAKNVVTDDNVKAFFEHMMEEEQEHREKVQNLLERVENIQVISKPDEGVVEVDRRISHVARRDQNILTVGSLYGVRQ
jgi:ferritin-like metal-binding protein YciE